MRAAQSFPRVSLNVTTPPATEPVTLADAKAWNVIETTEDDALITGMITGARERLEDYCNRSFIDTGWTLTLDGFPSGLLLVPKAATSITEIRYQDTDNAPQTVDLANVVFDPASRPARLVRAPDYVWPETYDSIATVEIDFTAGYGAAEADVPERVRQAIMMLIGHYYEHREAAIGTLAIIREIPFGIRWMVYNERYWTHG